MYTVGEEGMVLKVFKIRDHKLELDKSIYYKSI